MLNSALPYILIRSALAVVLLVTASVAGVLIAWNAGYGRSSFTDLLSWQFGRPVTIRGPLKMHLLHGCPLIEAEQVTIGNPPWTPPGMTAQIAKLAVVGAPLFGHQSGLKLVRLDGARLNLFRDNGGRANWQRGDPEKSSGEPLPVIRELQVTHSHLTLVDDRLHLAYDGNLTIDGPDSAQALKIEGSGTLNQHAVTLRLTGDALPSATGAKPYAFEVDERSSGTELVARGSLPHPFDVRFVDAVFDAHGADVRDLYYLVGVNFPNTGPYRLQGRVSRRDSDMRFGDLKLTFGQSDLSGTVAVTTQYGHRTFVRADLSSTRLRLADVGLRAAGRDPHPGAPPRLFADVRLITPAIRGLDAAGKYTVRQLLLSRVVVSELTAPFSIERGRIQAPEISGHLAGGQFVLHVDTDANQTPSFSRLGLTVTDLQLAQLPHQSEPPPYAGPLQLSVRADGRGDSLHALAGGAQGTLRAHLVNGTLRASLAELIGVDLRGLGLTLTGSHRDMGFAYFSCRK